MFAISSMVRNFPAGLDAFRSLHGYNTLSTKLGLSSLGPLQRAILTFYNDLLDQDIQVRDRRDLRVSPLKIYTVLFFAANGSAENVYSMFLSGSKGQGYLT